MFLTTIHHKKHSPSTHMNRFPIIFKYKHCTVILTSSFFQLAVLHIKFLHTHNVSDEQQFNKLYECDSNYLQLRANSHPMSAYKLQVGLINIHKNYKYFRHV